MDKKVAIVTGASSDIGLAISKRLLDENYFVFMTYHKNAISLNEKEYKNASFIPCDMSKEEDILHLVEEVTKKYKKVDVVVNNAALSLDCLIEEKTKEEFMRVLEVNVVGPFLLVKHLKEYLKDGVVINIASTDGMDTFNEYNIDYSTSKAGLIHMTKVLAYALPSTKIYCLSLNFVNTKAIREMNPFFLESELKRVGQKKLIEPEVIGKKVLETIHSHEKSGSNFIIKGDSDV